jgi:hypothetical protein
MSINTQGFTIDDANQNTQLTEIPVLYKILCLIETILVVVLNWSLGVYYVENSRTQVVIKSISIIIIFLFTVDMINRILNMKSFKTKEKYIKCEDIKDLWSKRSITSGVNIKYVNGNDCTTVSDICALWNYSTLIAMASSVAFINITEVFHDDSDNSKSHYTQVALSVILLLVGLFPCRIEKVQPKILNYKVSSKLSRILHHIGIQTYLFGTLINHIVIYNEFDDDLKIISQLLYANISYCMINFVVSLMFFIRRLQENSTKDQEYMALRVLNSRNIMFEANVVFSVVMLNFMIIFDTR